ncbi:unnamed protein product [Kluyveromyces dobzhanskii CBS 2104]|uniref:WGS project CCBQ000000000 data, contig 00058 n=1 Tax=Kluyveromyces dobzhanskii CBS 2104 TaxID=1427455 RepID=A0A0A8LDY5_9SACH|nr:unnamed protein product [Kluyveromyces dobzhanskii CBS 2104]
MSFFGLDATGRKPRERRPQGEEESLDFEDSYQGLGDHALEEDDLLNDETFGTAADLGADFDFGYGKGGLDAGADAGKGSAPAPVSYAAIANAKLNGQTNSKPGFEQSLDMQPMESLWGNSDGLQQVPQQVPQQGPQQFQAPPQVHQQGAPNKEGMSMQTLERQQQMGIAPQPGFYGMQPPQGPGYGFMPQGFPQGQFQQFPGQNVPPVMPNQFGNGGFPNQPVNPQEAFQQMPPVMYNQAQGNGPPHMQHPQVAVPPMHNQPSVQQHPRQLPPQPLPQQQQQSQPQQQQQMFHQPHSAETNIAPQSTRGTQQFEHTNSPMPLQPKLEQIPTPPHTPRDYRRGPRRFGPQDALTDDELRRLQVRQSKVDKILRHSGVMTPRDKDFITRYQLSQIVTDDPYNEDFYFQVYKIIQRGVTASESNKDSIAKAYLEHSGHRLGGRYKRTDVALQRMQSQVEKAVTVAKERPQKSKGGLDSAKEGVLGKISATRNSKAPRKQLQIPTHKEDSPSLSSQSSSALDEVSESLQGVDINAKRRRSSYALSSSVDQRSVLTRSGGRKFILSLIETVYEEVLELEAQLRSGQQPDSTKLWEALHIEEHGFDVSPFISILSFDKGIKIIPRIMNFLSREEKIKLFTCFFRELSHLNVIVISSYKISPLPTKDQLKKVELFQSVFLKIIVSFLSSSAEFLEVMSLLINVIQNNNVSFITTSRIGLNLITVLISRAALMKQDVSRGKLLSSVEVSTWSEVYDRLFTSLETKLTAIFPTTEYMQHAVSVYDQDSSQYDQSYIWQFLASLALSGKLNHQRILIDEVRDEIFEVISKAEELNSPSQQDPKLTYQRNKYYQDLNLFLNVMGLVARDGEITELK